MVLLHFHTYLSKYTEACHSFMYELVWYRCVERGKSCLVPVYLVAKLSGIFFFFVFWESCFGFSYFIVIEKQQVCPEPHTNFQCFSIILPVIAGSLESLSYGASCFAECVGE